MSKSKSTDSRATKDSRRIPLSAIFDMELTRRWLEEGVDSVLAAKRAENLKSDAPEQL